MNPIERKQALESLHEDMFAGTSRTSYTQSLEHLQDALQRGASEQEINELFAEYQREATALAQDMGPQYAERVQEQLSTLSPSRTAPDVGQPGQQEVGGSVDGYNPAINPARPAPTIDQPGMASPTVGQPGMTPSPAVGQPAPISPSPAVGQPSRPSPRPSSPAVLNEIPIDHRRTDTHQILYYEQQQKYAMQDLSTQTVADVGVTNNPQAVDAYIDITHAQGRLNQQSLSEGITHMNQNPQAATNVINRHEQRLTQQQAYQTQVSRQQYTTQQLSNLPAVDPAMLQRQGMGQGQVDWNRVNNGVNGYLQQGGDPMNGNAMRAYLAQQGFSNSEQQFAASLADDPIRIDQGGMMMNGRHRLDAMRSQGVQSTLIQDQGRVAYDRNFERKIMAGQNVMAPQVDLNRSMQHQVYPNESAAINAVRQQAGIHASPAHDIAYKHGPGVNARISATELEDGRAMAMATNLDNQQVMVLGQHDNMAAANAYGRNLTAQQLRQVGNFDQLQFTPAELAEARSYQQGIDQMRATHPQHSAPVLNKSGHPRPNMNDPAERARIMADYDRRQQPQQPGINPQAPGHDGHGF